MKEETSNTEQSILKAAEKEFLKKGFSGSKTTEIAKEAGVTHAMLKKKPGNWPIHFFLV